MTWQRSNSNQVSSQRPAKTRLHWLSLAKLLEPALRMASCILHEPCVLPFFTGLLQHRSEIPDAPEATTVKFGKLYRFEMAPMPGNNKERDDSEATFMYMNQMKRYVQFTFGGTQNACDGLPSSCTISALISQTNTGPNTWVALAWPLPPYTGLLPSRLRPGRPMFVSPMERVQFWIAREILSRPRIGF